MLTKIESELNQLLKSRGVNLDTRMGIMIILKHESIYRLMIRWIKKNPNARQCEILRQMDVIRPDQPNAVHAVPKTPRKTRRIARVAML